MKRVPSVTSTRIGRQDVTGRAALPAQNLLSALPPEATDEIVDVLVSAEGMRLERIVSHGHASPEDFWYDQEEAEWILVLTGRARLRIEGDIDDLELVPGDSLYLPRHCRHRITWTHPDQPTVWLALFMAADRNPQQGELGT